MCADATVIGADVAYPTDSGLLAKAVGKLVRTAQRVRELADLAEQAAVEAAAVLRNGRRAVPKALSGRVRGRLRRALGELAVTIEPTATIVAQARTRLAGQAARRKLLFRDFLRAHDAARDAWSGFQQHLASMAREI